MRTVRWEAAAVAAALVAISGCSDAPLAPAPHDLTPASALSRERGSAHATGLAADSALLELARERSSSDEGELLRELEADRPWLFGRQPPDERSLPELSSAGFLLVGNEYAPSYGVPTVIYSATTGGDIPCPSVGCSTGYVEASTTFMGHRARHRISYHFYDPRAQRGTYARQDGLVSEGAHCRWGGVICIDKRHHDLISVLDLPRCDIALEAGTMHEVWWTVGFQYTQWNFTLKIGDFGFSRASSRLDTQKRRDCQERTTGGGGGSPAPGGGTLVWICRYLDYYDGNGNFMFTESQGCRQEFVNDQ